MTNRSDFGAGAIFILFGAFFGIQAMGLELGRAIKMGPGYFPLVLAGFLVVLGLALCVRAFLAEGAPFGVFAGRGAVFILAAPIFFGLTVRGLGFVPTVFLTAVIAAFASRKMRLIEILLMAVGLTLFATLVFSYGLGLPLRRFGPWLGF
ncbi:tripartite tricarboxylate transporter TctB family protein [Tabrizicola sp.]|uniref:tripartite tricarboxylate transporter TctB family protein n=1 Tax=Tabrizicola sp. TaxID=2005166 RepID=UPI003F3FEE58